MARFLAEVRIDLKPGVHDPEGEAIRSSLVALGFGEVEAVRGGRLFQVWIEAVDAAAAGERVDAMCRRLLANPVLEVYRVSCEAVGE